MGSFGERSRKLFLQTMLQPLDWEVQFAVWKTLLNSGIPQLVQVAKRYPVPLRPVGNPEERYRAGERDFRWADLRGGNLSRLDLRGLDLSGASLVRARLSQVNLSHTSLIGANLSQADLSGADLRGANLKGANLMGANLIGANLQGANLADANLKWVVISPETQIDRKWRLVWEIVNGHAQ
ncbi:pentapeptide repeat-containing protein, partial [Synechococcus sp. H55.6]